VPAIGKNVVAVDPRYTSSTYSKCGFRKKENVMAEPSGARAAAFQIDADLNASRNISTFSKSDRSGLKSLAKSTDFRPW
jgi:transposase